MIEEYLNPKRGTFLRRNGKKKLVIFIEKEPLDNIFIINGGSFITNNLSNKDLSIAPYDYYMLINNRTEKIKIKFDLDISNHDIIYNPYKYERAQKVNIDPNPFINKYNVPEGFSDILSKWYSIKFTYPEHNLIYVKPEMGISIQVHKFRSETWEILEGKPIIINGDKVYYFIKNGTQFVNTKNRFHSIINPNKNPDEFVKIKENWSGIFDENDIDRVYNPNKYY